MRRWLPLLVGAWVVSAVAQQPVPVVYHLSFPQAQHHRMQVEVTFPDLPPGRLEVVMSRSSPGRYAMHEFAKNVYDVRVDDGGGRTLAVEQPDPSRWHVSGHAGVVRVRYTVFGDRVDGTYLAIDETHAHLNMPASLVWARGLETRPVRVTFDAPADWKVATQLHPAGDARTFAAGSLQYLMDSPVELSAHTSRAFSVDREFRLALHHLGSDADADRFLDGLERIVREQRAIFGEFPAFEQPYTFIADYLPWASFDGMEHRNSTILTAQADLSDPGQRLSMLSTAAHEFFHVWNVERIRPRSLEPFRLDAANPSGELWFAEGFTSYYEALTMARTGLWSLDRFAARAGELVDAVTRTPARKYRSAVGASLFAQYVDQGAWNDPTNFGNHHFSYYTWGAALGLALDLSLRVRTDSRVTLDDYMRRLWIEFGRPAPPLEGAVARPYVLQDLRSSLAEVSGDRAFADEFFDRFVLGRENADFASLLDAAGLRVERRRAGQAWLGAVSFDAGAGTLRVASPTTEDTPAHLAGLDRGDELIAVEGQPIRTGGQLEEAVSRRRPGDALRLTIRRRGAVRELTVRLGDDPRLSVATFESIGRAVPPRAQAFREAWLAAR